MDGKKYQKYNKLIFPQSYDWIDFFLNCTPYHPLSCSARRKSNRTKKHQTVCGFMHRGVRQPNLPIDDAELGLEAHRKSSTRISRSQIANAFTPVPSAVGREESSEPSERETERAKRFCSRSFVLIFRSLLARVTVCVCVCVHCAHDGHWDKIKKDGIRHSQWHQLRVKECACVWYYLPLQEKQKKIVQAAAVS